MGTDPLNSDLIYTSGTVVYSTVPGLELCWYQRIGMSVFFHLEVNASGRDYSPFPDINDYFDFGQGKQIYITGGTGASNNPVNGNFTISSDGVLFATGSSSKVQFNNFVSIIGVK